MCGIFNLKESRKDDLGMARIAEFGSYIGFSLLVGGFTTYFFKFGVWLFLTVFLFNTSDQPSTYFSIVTYFLLITVLSILYGLSVFGFFTMIKYYLELINIQLRMHIGLIISTLAALYTLLCFLELFFPQLPIPSPTS